MIGRAQVYLSVPGIIFVCSGDSQRHHEGLRVSISAALISEAVNVASAWHLEHLR